jgi:hypothetical protein
MICWDMFWGHIMIKWHIMKVQASGIWNIQLNLVIMTLVYVTAQQSDIPWYQLISLC